MPLSTARVTLQGAASKIERGDGQLERLLFPGKYSAVSMYVEPDYPYIHRELAKHGVALTLLWEEYCRKRHESGKTSYQSTQFGEKYR